MGMMFVLEEVGFLVLIGKFYLSKFLTINPCGGLKHVLVIRVPILTAVVDRHVLDLPVFS